MRIGLAAVVLGGAFVAGGCHKNRQEDIPEGAIPQPLGTSVNEYFRRQAEVGETDAFVVYLYEWDGEGTDLDPWSHQRVSSLVGRLSAEPYVFVVQPSDDRRLDDARRRALVSMVSREGIAHADRRVVIGYPRADGLYGMESPRIMESIEEGGAAQSLSGSARQTTSTSALGAGAR